MSGFRLCAAYGCEHRIPVKYFICQSHFAKLPGELQGEINEASARFMAREPGADRAMVKAQSAALRALRELLIKGAT